MTRIFEDAPARREQTPLLVGLVGPSGTGKTFSALRLATGIQRVSGGEVFVIDTEARRALHYADRFAFRHLPFGAPFGPLDYLAAVEHCHRKGAGVIVVDSMSHEHEGPGGVLEMHAAEVERMAKGDQAKAERVKMAAWIRPKADRRRLINTLLQLQCNFVFCFRAKERLEVRPGREPVKLGYMPIAGDEFVYEMTLKCVLLPGADGTPTWRSEYPGEAAMMKCPQQFRGVFATSPQLSEDIGQQLAEWAAGSAAAAPDVRSLIARYDRATPAELTTLEAERAAVWARLTAADRKALKAASDLAKSRPPDARPVDHIPGVGDPALDPK